MRGVCDNTTQIHADGDPLVSIIMCIAGVVGNLVALAILGVHQRGRHAKSSVFSILVTGLVLTDLLGIVIVSPPAFLAYARNASLVGLTGPGSNRWLCDIVGFAMTFFGLASMLILCAMAVERCLAISHPYVYGKHVRTSYAKITLPLVYLFSGSFCSLPLLGDSRYKQYCPGTWCYIRMEAKEGSELAFSLGYASLMAFLIAAVCLCNSSVIVSLFRMYRGQLVRQGSAPRKGSLWFRRGEEEVDHLVLLGCITVIFIVCSVPLTACGFVSTVLPDRNDQKKLLALRFSSLNPILDPWVFIIFRKAVFRHVLSVLRCCLWGSRTAPSPSLNAGHTLPSTALQPPSYSTIPLGDIPRVPFRSNSSPT